MAESLHCTPEELAKMTPRERRKALRQRSQREGQRWLEENSPNQKSGPQTLEDLLKALEETFNS